MFRLLKKLARLARILFVSALCVCVGLVVLLYVTKVPLPAWAIDQFNARLSTPSLMVNVQNASVSLRHGVTLGDAQVRMNVGTNDLFLKTAALHLDLAIRPGRPWIEWLESIRLVHPEGSFLPATLLASDDLGGGEFLRNTHLSRVGITLDEPSFADIAPTRVTADLSLRDQEIVLENICAEWAGGVPEAVVGTVRFDTVAKTITVQASGLITQRHVWPVLVLVDSPQVLHYADNITSPDVPLTVSCDLTLTPQLQTLVFKIKGHDLSWRGVPVVTLNCAIEAINPVAQKAWQVTITPLSVVTTNGSGSATLIYNETKGQLALEAKAAIPAIDLFNMIEVLHTGQLDHVHIEGVPYLTLSGTIDADSTRVIPYDLTGTIEAPGVDLYGLALAETSCTLTVRDQWTVRFDDIQARLKHGGLITGGVGLDLTESASGLPFEADLALKKASPTDFLKLLKRTNTWEGVVDGSIALTGNLTSNTVDSFNGSGTFAVSKALIARVPLFAGFTDYLARNIPGVDLLVSQSDASLSFRINNGILQTDDFLVEGSFFSISGKIKYAITRDMLDGKAHVNIFRRGSLVGRVTRIVTLPFDRLLLEFRITGPAEQPVWNYRGIIQRIVGSVMGSSSDTPIPQEDETP